MRETANISRDRNTGEYVVRLFIDGVHHTPADYFTDDLEDARDTAKAMVEDAETNRMISEVLEEEKKTRKALQAAALQELMEKHDEARAIWVENRGSDIGFDKWFTGQVDILIAKGRI